LTELMTSKNLLFADCTNQCYVPEKNPNRDYGDINMGNAYYRFHSTIDEDKRSHTTIIPLMFFANGMMIDKCGRLGQEPWMYTLGIFNRNVRNQPSLGKIWDLQNTTHNMDTQASRSNRVIAIGDAHSLQM